MSPRKPRATATTRQRGARGVEGRERPRKRGRLTPATRQPTVDFGQPEAVQSTWHSEIALPRPLNFELPAMGNIRRTVLALPLLFTGPALLAPGLLPHVAAAGKGLTDAEIYQIDTTAKDFAIDLIDARIWTKDSDEYRQFRRYAPRDTVRIAVYDTDNRRFFENRFTEITGAEYRRALATARAITSYARLDADGQARINQEIYGQATTPERGSDAHTRGRERIARIAGIVAGERQARPAETQGQTGKKDK